MAKLLVRLYTPRGKLYHTVPAIASDAVDTYMTEVNKILRTITFRVSTVRHTCSYNAVEIGLSDCKAGCKIMRCTLCGCKSTVHNKWYGCPKAA